MCQNKQFKKNPPQISQGNFDISPDLAQDVPNLPFSLLSFVCLLACGGFLFVGFLFCFRLLCVGFCCHLFCICFCFPPSPMDRIINFLV